MNDDELDFDAVLDGIALRDGRAGTRVSAAWGQGRATFGGLVGAILLRAMAAGTGRERTPRSLHVDFVGPVEPGPLDVRVEVLRAGRAATHVAARIVQDGQPRAVGHAVFGAARSSTLRLRPARPPDVHEAAALVDVPVVPGVTPAFLRWFCMRFATGDMLFSGSTGDRIGGWCRLRGPTRATPHEVVTALVDLWPASVLPNLRAPAPVSSLTWAMDLAGALPAIDPDAWWQYEAVTEHAADGYALSRACLWDERGELVAASRQNIAVFDVRGT